ncbi:NAD(P)H-dependent amine dehydrogenase family protein [Sphingopyxis sp. R3-92]|uniref:NAD(P)H-dependent amine dehydrogenase family protein n=1 Tax=Sphingopyxis sp. R3-92 TaxID=3158553 RepID=UPI003EE75BA2
MPYRVVQWATGAMGRTSLRRIIDHPDLELAGCYVYSADKAGVDAGTLVGRPETGVLATSDIEQILALDADVVLHMPRITLPYEKMNGDVERLLASGKNLISIAGFHAPWAHEAAYADPLRAACAAGNATLAGLGVNPGTIVERIALAATGLCQTVDRVIVHETVDASGMAAPGFVFGLMGFGSDPAKVDIRKGPLAELYTQLFSETLHLAAQGLGDRIVGIESAHQLTLAPHDITVAAGVIPQGTVAATRWCWIAQLAGGRAIELAILWTSDPLLHPEVGPGHWTIRVEGRPNIHMTLSIDEADPAMPRARALTDATVSVALSAIPHVVAADPGFFAYPHPPSWRARLKEAE